MCVAMPSCRRLLTQLARLAFSFAALNAGRSMPARIAMIAMTTSNSIRVKPRGIEPEFRNPKEDRNPKAEIVLCFRVEKVLLDQRLEPERSCFGLRISFEPRSSIFGLRVEKDFDAG